MKRLRPLLIGLNLLAFTVLGIVYYFGFVEWVITAPLGWGLPAVIASLTALVAGVMVWNKHSYNWGVMGIGTSIVAFIYLVILLNNFSYVMLPEQNDIPRNGQFNVENEILSGILSERAANNDYIVVKPRTTIPANIQENNVNTNLARLGYDLPGLVELFFELNEEPAELTLSSSHEEGYYIDYDGIFERYIDERWFPPLKSWLLRPQVLEYARVSKPAYDLQTGYGLIYLIHTSNSNRPLGSAELYLFTYDGQEVTMIDIVKVWY